MNGQVKVSVAPNSVVGVSVAANEVVNVDVLRDIPSAILAQILTAAADDTVAVGVGVEGSAAKTSLVAADYLPLLDSAADNTLKKITFANLLAALNLTGVSTNVQTQLDGKVDESLLTTAGDIAYATGAGAWARLGVTANRKLFSKADGSAVEWATGYKAGTFTRDLSVATGNVSITGVGFTPTKLLLFACVNGTQKGSIAIAGNGGGIQFYPNTQTYLGTMAYDIMINDNAGNFVTGAVQSADTDGFTLKWTKSGSPTGTATVYYLALR